MFFFLSFTLICTSSLASASTIGFSYSASVGNGGGISYATEGNGRITAIRVWERPNSFVTSLQLCYDYIWSERIGKAGGNLQEMQLYDDETIIQVSGKHSNFIFQLVFVTSRGRFFSAGSPTGFSFHFYPTDSKAGLRLLSGRYTSSGITSLGAHWGEVITNQYRGSRRR
ncbi:zymogen granule membrane protein 16-like [Labrus bergylta]|uniref:Zymogen granule membrane protein 16-like n=1 Tax=Labrus bergylta TaxID=56723 RepID=A0A3Q3EQH4_9LABR